MVVSMTTEYTTLTRSHTRFDILSTMGKRLARRIRFFLSHWPTLYALIVGVGIVLFWRGVWYSVDVIHRLLTVYNTSSPLDSFASLWWDGPLSFIIGSFILYITGAFISSFIGNELILSGLRGEKKLSERTESEVKTEVSAIADIKRELGIISQKLEQLETIRENK